MQTLDGWNFCQREEFPYWQITPHQLVSPLHNVHCSAHAELLDTSKYRVDTVQCIVLTVSPIGFDHSKIAFF